MGAAMMRITTAILLIAVIVSGIGVSVAQDIGTEVQVLAVETPQTVEVNTPAPVMVTDRENGTPVPSASVYALTWPHLSFNDVSRMILTPAYECVFLGKTTNDGSVEHAFDRVGRVLVLATKEQWGPGIASFMVKPQLTGKLAIDAPTRAPKDESVTVGVVERDSGDHIAGADLWAIELPARCLYLGTDIHFGELNKMIIGLSENSENNSGNITQIIKSIGEHLDQTDSRGVVEWVCDEVGMYLLVATKSEYVPGFRVIAIVEDNALVIAAKHMMADIGESVNFAARTKGTGTPVDGVDLYIMEPSWLRSGAINLKDIVKEGKALEQMAIENGEYIGTTDENGKWIYQFQEKGIYLVVGIKEGYVTGITSVYIGQFGGLRQLLPIPQIKRFKERLGPEWHQLYTQGLGQHLDLHDTPKRFRR
ncbi:MAG: hypothetical protein JSW38_01500 [Dehalococcoidia bacterium]|nr:MAG: hypothetical protein JSW38_01500 [Dehalococcoidia bacterium]